MVMKISVGDNGDAWARESWREWGMVGYIKGVNQVILHLSFLNPTQIKTNVG